MAPKEQVRVLLADDHADVRSALRLLLDQDRSMRVVGEVQVSGDLVREVSSTAPDLLLLDWELPGRTADLVSALRHASPRLHIIALSSLPQAQGAALSAGADEFVSKGDPPETLLASLRRCRENRGHGSCTGAH